jgi:formamidopyrimidine-DNA glycosylase
MPELPEVETTRRGVEPFLYNQKILRIIVREHRLRWPVPADLAGQICGRVITRVGRRAKYLLIQVDTGCMLIHLGMSGSLRLVAHGDAPQKHDHIDFILADRTLRYRDPRRFGAVLWHQGPLETHPLLAHLGPEPLDSGFDQNTLFLAIRGKSSAIKLLLMNNRVVVGVGNIYANEALFEAGIHPARAGNSLSPDDAGRLVAAIRKILARSIELGGSTLRDFIGPDSRAGYFQQTYQTYGRNGLPCPVCGTAIQHLRQGQRSSYYCPRCQAC